MTVTQALFNAISRGWRVSVRMDEHNVLHLEAEKPTGGPDKETWVSSAKVTREQAIQRINPDRDLAASILDITDDSKCKVVTS